MQFIHCADIHLDSPLVGLESYPEAPIEQIRSSTRRSFEHIVQVAIDKNIAFMVIAGDLYDGDQQDYGTALYFVRQMARLKDAGVLVFIVQGNHDAASKLTKTLKLPDNVHLFRSSTPDTKLITDLGVAIHGQSFARRDIREDLASAYPRQVPDALNIGLLHTCLSGYVGHEPYAPTTLDIMRAKGYQYWALGHVHTRTVYSEDPWVIHPGNSQGRSVRETGEKSCELVTTEATKIIDVEPTPTSHVLWHRLPVDCGTARSLDDVSDQVDERLRAVLNQEDRLCCVRVELVGATSADPLLRKNADKMVAQVQAIALDISRDQLWIERVRVSTSLPTSRRTLADMSGPLLETKEILDRARSEVGLQDYLVDALAELRAKLPDGLTNDGSEAITFDREYISKSLDGIEQELIARLAEGTDA
jgi:DNA repair exonuclease SbcCD nuclease subunit